MEPLVSLEDRTPPMAALAVAIVAVSTSAILIRFSDAPSVVKAFYRVVLTTLLLAPVAVTRYRDDLAALSGRDLTVAVVTGVALAAHFATWFESLNWTSVAASVTLVQAQPIFVAMGAAALLDERISRRMVFGILVAVAGTVEMSLGGFLSGAALAGARPLYGNGLALVGAVMAAGYVLAGRSLRQRVALVPYVTVVYTVCAVVLLGVAVAEGAVVAPTAYPPHEWLLFLGMAVGPGIFGHTVINWALKYVESSVVSVTLLGEPVGSTLLALALLGEVPDAFTVVGGVVVLLGIYVTATGRESAA
ncbi:DMT family transporter [Halorussus halophilus]|uniref:DMT family transporter n=1 Tax=Halorussus halophilus TaxID=2650975 RepID=UPI00130152EA|nr:DMT family transporter [Halorussus halophilus]